MILTNSNTITPQLLKIIAITLKKHLSRTIHRIVLYFQMTALQQKMTAQLNEINDRHQIMADVKLAKLSTVLDEVKVNREELAKFRKLLRSLSMDITQHNEQ